MKLKYYPRWVVKDTQGNDIKIFDAPHFNKHRLLNLSICHNSLWKNLTRNKKGKSSILKVPTQSKRLLPMSIKTLTANILSKIQPLDQWQEKFITEITQVSNSKKV